MATGFRRYRNEQSDVREVKCRRTHADDALVGDILGKRYRILQKIGDGGVCNIYRAEDQKRKKEVAIKIEKESRETESDEATLMCCLDHPNIVRYLGDGKHEWKTYLVLELLSGDNLHNMLGDISWDESKDVLIQLCRALDAIHCAGIVHKDVKPTNVFVTHDGVVKLLDFGIAKRRSGVLIDKKVSGTPTYIAPEVASGAMYDHRVDIYGLGVMMYKLLCGIEPFVGDSLEEILIKSVHLDADPPSTRNPAVPSAIDRIVMKALAKFPGHRYSSAEELRQELEECREGLTRISILAAREEETLDANARIA